ncbi:secreted RxLR effector protein 161-like [Salvia splendens]|uniref:secreted RxLR effector protein 161-like n=1 Tax=Salvia splendens TaxID=180675 RepID=UPI001C253D85|nr:secreted RxLR effector protein 161-like [Salvia splendens]
MFDAKLASVPLAAHFMLSKDMCPKSKTDIEAMKKVPYANAIGSVMYLMVSTRPDIAYAVSCLSRYMANPGPVHWEALKWLLRYLKHTTEYELCYSKCNEGVSLTGFVDSNYANDRDKRKSTTSYVFTICRFCISWKSQLQHIVALSTTESEYIALTEAMKEIVWLKGVLSELKFVKFSPTVFSDSQSSIKLCKNNVFRDKTKHIDVRFHYIRDIVEKCEVFLQKVHTDINPADMGTESLPFEKLLFYIKHLHFDLR